MRVTVLGSGSAGNATLVEAEGTCILVDAGFSGSDLARRLRSLELEPEAVTAIVITHDHIDHTRGMGVLARRFGIPLYLTERTWAACGKLLNGTERVVPYASQRPVSIGALEVQPFLTVHDAADPVAITVSHPASGCKLGVATDLGRPTTAVRASLAGCHMLVLEANHDEALLWRGPYPWSVKQRIASSHGHLSNRAAAELARELLHPELVATALAHLSEHCNAADLARDTVGAALETAGFRGWLRVAPQGHPLDTVDLLALRQQCAPGHQLSLL